MKNDGQLVKGIIGAAGSEEKDEMDWEMEEGVEWEEYWDDISGKKLDTARVSQARKEEMEGIKTHTIYEHVPIQQRVERAGKKPIGVRWVDITKGDTQHPEYRSRLVAKENQNEQKG